jgi:[ribosomal protein S5]-alanine N-acetyltransferase
MGIGTITINTKRLTLRKISLDDVEAIYAHLKSDERVTDNLVKGIHKSSEETLVMVKEIIDQYEDSSFYYWGMELIESKVLIGLIDLYDFNSNETNCNVGYLIGYNWWNKGYGTEALRAVVDFAFNYVKVNEISAAHNTDNPASGRIMEKVGMQKDCIVKDMITNAKGQSKDCAIYRIKKI